ncbi:hypothetical protein LTR84_010968 [Exophiala bonariae]|uniref:Peptidase A1 domain-containing protein n=1 Tax=Exophiala bonariae TaxID=1690606 RepID=A0AAV9NIC2_9EURO|nr:hypothetical protein LTR84_010968 [Exophiala bonariae]
MAPSNLILSFILLAFTAAAQDPNASPWQIAFNTTTSIGPDGPWWFITQAVDFPDQKLSVFPSLSETSIIMSSGACSALNADCALPIQAEWTPSDSWKSNNGSQKQSEPLDPTKWDDRVSSLLGLDGTGYYAFSRMTLYSNGNTGSLAYLDRHGLFVSDSMRAMYPGGAAYTLNVGLLSLYGAKELASWTGVNGSQFEANLTLNSAYISLYIPSKSFGLHVGSVAANIGGSLILGGYDSSRCLTEPITSDSTTFKLFDISLNVTRGISAFVNTDKSTISGLLQTSGDQAIGLEIQPEPGVPYLYLPKETCDAIASHLPVTYSEELNLYLWDTKAPEYPEIISSPHYLVFSFSSGADGTDTSNINVPFALLNLTLESPLQSKPTPYFPCSPWTSTETVPYHLGRAFLQAAFLSQNSHTNMMFLAQAPGPDHSAQNVKKITTTDTAIKSASNPPDWESTWTGTLKALTSSNSSNSDSGAANGTGTSSGNGGTETDTSDTTNPESKSGLSTKAICGIATAAVVGLGGGAFALWYFALRKRHQQSQHSRLLQPQELPPSPPGYASPAVWGRKGDGSPMTSELAGMPDGSTQHRYEVDSEYSDKGPNELDAKSRPAELASNSRAAAVELA